MAVEAIGIGRKETYVMEQRRSRRWLYLLLMVTVALGIGLILEKGQEGWTCVPLTEGK